MKSIKLIVQQLTVLLAIAGLASCGKSPSSTGASPQYLVIFSQCNNAEPYRAAQNAEMKKLWDAQPDVKLVIMDAQQDNSKQISQIETAIRQKPSLLIVAPNERAPLTQVMGEAMAASIPVICLERDIAEPNYTTWIRADNRAIGKMVGDYVVDRLKAKYGDVKGRIVELAGLKGVEAETNRREGANDVWKQYPGIVIATDVVSDWLQSKAKDRMTEVLSAVPQIDVVYGRNDPMAVGAYLAAKEKNREKEMIFVGIDGLSGESGGLEKVKDGVLAATFIYPLCVDKAVEIGNRILRDPKFVPDKVYTMPSKMVTAANVDQVLQQK
jgi:ABC-type sugar transport system substrate-binding protein